MVGEKPDDAATRSELLPVFIPPLAALLAHAERIKGKRLTEDEIIRVRDESVCMMMRRDEAAKLAESRGYRDVEPENCLADWHRLRVQLTGNGWLPKLVLCVLGSADLESRCRPTLDAEGVAYEWGEHDVRMSAAFQASACPCDPSLKSSDLASIGEHSRVLYVLSTNFNAQDALGVCDRFLRLGRRLLEAGAVAMKCESSGIAHGRERWLELAHDAKGESRCRALFRAFVQLPIAAGDDYYTCGLHLLGLPDLIVSDTILRQVYGPTDDRVWNAIALFRVFAEYLLTECDESRFHSGHTFSLGPASPRFRILWEDCTGYAEDDFLFNPFGRWRFAELIE